MIEGRSVLRGSLGGAMLSRTVWRDGPTRWCLGAGLSGRKMSAWMAHKFGDPLTLVDVPTPEVSTPTQVLLKVKAASVNPIDTVMCKGYGDAIFATAKRFREKSLAPTSREPFIAGRDCSAVVEHVGQKVTKFRKGDEVMAVVDATRPGTHAEYVLTEEFCCVKKPSNVSFVEATALPYVACTTWSALVSVARLKPSIMEHQRVLIHGGSGGVGTVAIQMLKAWGAPHVVATCSKDCFGLVSSLGGIPVDYSGDKVKDELVELGPFDVILDCADTDLARWSDKLMGVWRNSVHVTLISPLMRDTDRYGLPVGLLTTAARYACRSYESALKGRWFSYAYFFPNEECLEQLAHYLGNGKIKPIVEQTYPFKSLPEAYAKVFKRHGRGKTVIDFESEQPKKFDVDVKPQSEGADSTKQSSTGGVTGAVI